MYCGVPLAIHCWTKSIHPKGMYYSVPFEYILENLPARFGACRQILAKPVT